MTLSLLMFQVSTQPNSSFASHEDLQCTWSESRQSINESATPREIRPGESGDASASFNAAGQVPVLSDFLLRIDNASTLQNIFKPRLAFETEVDAKAHW